MKIFNGINSTFPGLVIWNETTHVEKRTAFMACERVPKNAVDTYRGRRLPDTEKVESCHTFSRYQRRGRIARNNYQ